MATRLNPLAPKPTLATNLAQIKGLPRPNVILIATKGPGPQEIPGTVAMPRLDSLRAEGLSLTNFHTEIFRTASYAALMTGRHAVRLGAVKLPSGGEYDLPATEVTLAELFQAAGYRTAMLGNWRLGRRAGHFPTDRGFDFWYGNCDISSESLFVVRSDTSVGFIKPSAISDSGDRTKTVRDAQPSGEPVEETMEARIEKIQARIAERRKRPPRRNRGLRLSEPLPKPEKALYRAERGEIPQEVGSLDWDFTAYDKSLTAMVPEVLHDNDKTDMPVFLFLSLDDCGYANIDARLGEVLDAIEAAGIAATTLILWIGSGPFEGAEDVDDETVRESRRGSATDLCTRAPLVIRWPALLHCGGERSAALTHITDLMPTLAAIAGLDQPKDRIVDGMDQSAVVAGKPGRGPREAFPIHQPEGLAAWQWQDWRVHYTCREGTMAPHETFDTPNVVQLAANPADAKPADDKDCARAIKAVAPLNAAFQQSPIDEPPPPPPPTLAELLFNSKRKGDA